ncbi:MAG: hypothetical protein LRY55_01595 [Leadbetterella sp.]|nr:hypothetical protein [Leadbetterella sp.]
MRVSETDAGLFNLTINSFIAHGVAEVRDLANEGGSQQVYFIKKLQFQ